MIITIITSFLALVLGTTVLHKNNHNKENIYFFLFTMTISLWAIALGLSNTPIETAWVINWTIFTWVISIFLPILFFAFSYTFILKKKKIPLVYYISACLSSIIILYIFIFGHGLSSEVTYYQNTIHVSLGGSFWIYLLLFFAWFVGNMYILVLGSRQNNGIDRLKTNLIILSFLPGSLIAVFFNLILPFLGNSKYTFLSGPFLTTIISIAITYAIIRHRLFDIQIQTQKILNVLLPVLLTMGVVTGTAYVVYNYTNLPRATVGITMVIFTVILYKISETVVAKTKFNHFLFQKTYRFHNALQQLANTASTITDFEQLVDTVANVFAQQGRIAQFGFVVITDQDQRDYMIYKNTGLPLAKLGLFSKPQLDDWFYHYVLQLAEPLLVDELYYAQPKGLATSAWHELQRQLEWLRGGVCIPLKVSHDLVGIIVLGSKERALAYTSEDLAVFTDISTPLAVAVTKSILFTQYREKITELSLEKNNLQSSMIELHNMKNEFLTIVDHQFNTPLSVIRGAFSMISDGDVPLAEIQDYVKDINPRIEEFHHIVQGMIEAAHFEGGTANMHFEPVALPALLAEVIKELEPRFAKHNVTLKINIDSTIQRVTSDPEKLKFALRHVLENAMFFGAGKTVEIQLTQPNKKDVVLHVRDYGRGFSSDEAKHIGQKFFRGQNVINFHPNGSGLGIYNARKIIHASGGELTFTSMGVGQGSVFTITLPKGAEFFKQVSLK